MSQRMRPVLGPDEYLKPYSLHCGEHGAVSCRIIDPKGANASTVRVEGFTKNTGNLDAAIGRMTAAGYLVEDKVERF